MITHSPWRARKIFALAAVLPALMALQAGAQVSKTAPLMTRFAGDVDPVRPWPEYPRPQMVRTDWLNLNGVWEYQLASDGEAAPVGKKLTGSIVVPYPIESALSGVMQHHERLWYRRTFSVPPAWKDRNVLLHFDAVDYESEPFLNGKSLGVHKGGYDAFTYDVTPYLQGAGEQELIVRVFDPTESGGQPRGKQAVVSHHYTYTPTTGIWQTVWLEPVPAAAIQDVKIVPDADVGAVRVTVITAKEGQDEPVSVRVEDGSRVVQTAEGRTNAEMTIPVANAKLWSPSSPFLYDLEISLGQRERAGDTVRSYFGMRKISLGKDHGIKKTFLNNQFIFGFGLLDQGFWPDGIYTAPTDAALRSDIEAMKEAGFNLVRKHIKVEPQRWYYWCDKLGLMVWQDMPAAQAYYARGTVPPPVETGEFTSELQRMVETHWNHPSIVMWVPFNEGQGQKPFDTGAVVGLIKKLDPTRLVNEASGGRHQGTGDIFDDHSYPVPVCPPPNADMALACGEFGGVGYNIPGHTWAAQGNGYVTAVSPADLLYYFGVYTDTVWHLREERGLSAVIYTELTDVEGETNGILTYDRLPKVELAKLAWLTRDWISPSAAQTVLATSEDKPQTWKFVTSKPAENWKDPSYDDAAWQEGSGGFGKQNGMNGHTPWSTPDLWLRIHFNPGQLSPDAAMHLVHRIWVDGTYELYLNGVSAYRRKTTTKVYQNTTLAEEARRALKPAADNVLAVHCLQNGQRFLDVGLSVLMPPTQ